MAIQLQASRFLRALMPMYLYLRPSAVEDCGEQMRQLTTGIFWRIHIFSVVGVMALIGLILVAAPSRASASDCLPTPAGMVAWWPGDSDTRDIIGTSHGTSMHGAGFDTAGKAGPTFSFDGVDDAVHVPDSDLWVLPGDFTIDLWVNFASVPSTPQEEAAVFVGNDEGPGDLNKWFFALRWDDELSFHINGPAPGNLWLVNAPFTPVLGQWYHLAITRAGNLYTVYVDGATSGSESSSVAIPNPDAPLTIGQAEDHLPTHGLIDELEIFNRALSAGEIAAIHDAGNAGKCKPNAHPVGLVDPIQGIWYLRHSASDVKSFFYGNPSDLPIAGDWDGDGIATPGLYRQSDGFFYARNSNTQGIADAECFAGNPADVPLAGDWDGDGDDNLGIYRPSEQIFYLFTTTCTGSPMGAAQISFLFGNPGDKPVAGDWDGDGVDEIGLHRETTGLFYWRNTLDTGIADGTIFFGNPGDRFAAGDWGIVDGKDTPAVFRPSNTTFYFRHTLTQGNADSQFVFGQSAWLPIAGDFGLG